MACNYVNPTYKDDKSQLLSRGEHAGWTFDVYTIFESSACVLGSYWLATGGASGDSG